MLLKNIHAEWEGSVTEDNGAYGLYPVECENVTMDNCYVRGASDAEFMLAKLPVVKL